MTIKNDVPETLKKQFRLLLAEELLDTLKDMRKDHSREEPSFSVSERLRALGPMIAYQARILDKEVEEEPPDVGTTVRKYEQLFERPGPGAAGGGTKNPRRGARAAPIPIPGDPIAESEDGSGSAH